MEDEFYPYKPKGFRYKRINSYFPFAKKVKPTALFVPL